MGATPTSNIKTPLATEDFYFDGPLMVFTAAYHLKRGYCCENDCRHCPYKVDGSVVKTAAEK
jgi:hypothetical protein